MTNDETNFLLDLARTTVELNAFIPLHVRPEIRHEEMIKSLEADGYLLHHHKHNPLHQPLPGGTSYVAITAKGCNAIGVHESRAKLTPATLPEKLRLSWFRYTGPGFRHPLFLDEARELLNVPIPNNVTWAVQEIPQSIAWRVYHCTAKPKNALDKLSQIIEATNELHLQPLGVACLSSTASMAKHLKEQIGNDTPIPVSFTVAPEPDDIPRMLAAWKRQRNPK